MNLCGDRKIASLSASGCWAQRRCISISTYGAAAAKSQNDSAPYRCSSSAIRQVSVTMPVTLDAAENEPILQRPIGVPHQLPFQRGHVDVTVRVLGYLTRSAIVSRHGSSLEWCSNGPMKTTGRASAGI